VKITRTSTEGWTVVGTSKEQVPAECREKAGACSCALGHDGGKKGGGVRWPEMSTLPYAVDEAHNRVA
jgi:hypothetical protein